MPPGVGIGPLSVNIVRAEQEVVDADRVPCSDLPAIERPGAESLPCPLLARLHRQLMLRVRCPGPEVPIELTQNRRHPIGSALDVPEFEIRVALGNPRQ